MRICVITKDLLSSTRFLSVYDQGLLEFMTSIQIPLISCIYFRNSLYGLDTNGYLWEINISELLISTELLDKLGDSSEIRRKSAQAAIGQSMVSKDPKESKEFKEILITEVQLEEKIKRKSEDIRIRRNSTESLGWTSDSEVKITSREFLKNKLRNGTKIIRRKSGDLVPDSRKSKEITASHRKSGEVISNHRKSEEVTVNHRKSGEIISNHRKSGEVTASHRKSKEIISNHRKSGEVPSDQKKPKENVIRERAIGSNNKIYQLEWKSKYQFKPDNFGGLPRWLAVQGNALMAGGNGINNKSIYLIHFNLSKDGTIKKHKFQVQQIDLSEGFQDLNQKLADHDPNFSPDKLYYYRGSVITNEATHYLVEDIFSNIHYLLTKEDNRTSCLPIPKNPAPIKMIVRDHQSVMGVFSIPNGLMVGKLNPEKGVITRKLKTLMFRTSSQINRSNLELDCFVLLN